MLRIYHLVAAIGCLLLLAGCYAYVPTELASAPPDASSTS